MENTVEKGMRTRTPGRFLCKSLVTSGYEELRKDRVIGTRGGTRDFYLGIREVQVESTKERKVELAVEDAVEKE